MTTSLIQDNAVPRITTFRKLAAAGTNLTSVVAGRARLHSLSLQGTTAAIKYVKIYDKATAPVVATDVPKYTFAVPASGQMINPEFGFGIPFDNGIAIAMTGAIGDTDTTALVANDVIMNMGYRTIENF